MLSDGEGKPTPYLPKATPSLSSPQQANQPSMTFVYIFAYRGIGINVFEIQGLVEKWSLDCVNPASLLYLAGESNPHILCRNNQAWQNSCNLEDTFLHCSVSKSTVQPCDVKFSIEADRCTQGARSIFMAYLSALMATGHFRPVTFSKGLDDLKSTW